LTVGEEGFAHLVGGGAATEGREELEGGGGLEVER